jgi:NTE family protein
VRTTLSALDSTLTKPGLLAGNRLIEIFGPLLGDTETFKELVLPCQVVAADIHSGERVAIGSGRLDAAFRASCSAPVIWAPVRRDGRVLVDGAIVEPVPAQLVSEMGADVCIAVNVVPPLKEGVETVISRMYRKLNRLNPLSYVSDSRDLPNLLDIVMNSIQMLQYELGNFKAISADVRINPDLSGYTWIEFYRAMELIERGAEATERALPEIRRVLDERIGASISLRTARRDRADAS